MKELNYITDIVKDHSNLSIDLSFRDRIWLRRYGLDAGIKIAIRSSFVEITSLTFNYKIPFDTLEDLEQILPYFIKKTEKQYLQLFTIEEIMEELEEQHPTNSRSIDKDDHSMTLQLDGISRLDFFPDKISIYLLKSRKDFYLEYNENTLDEIRKLLRT